MEKLSDYLIEYTKYQYRKLKFVPLLVTTILIFLFVIPYLTKDYIDIGHDIPPFDGEGYIPIPKPEENSICPHYKIGLFISSEVEDIEKRMLMREELFGITDNLIPCMKQDAYKVFYRFFVKKKKSVTDDDMRRFKSEQMDFNDIEEIKPQGNDDWQQALLKHVSNKNRLILLQLPMIKTIVFFYSPNYYGKNVKLSII